MKNKAACSQRETKKKIFSNEKMHAASSTSNYLRHCITWRCCCRTLPINGIHCFRTFPRRHLLLYWLEVRTKVQRLQILRRTRRLKSQVQQNINEVQPLKLSEATASSVVFQYVLLLLLT